MLSTQTPVLLQLMKNTFVIVDNDYNDDPPPCTCNSTGTVGHQLLFK